MKHLTFLSIILVASLYTSSPALAQSNDTEEKQVRPEKAARQAERIDHLNQQWNYWKQQTVLNPSNAEAWYKFYASRRSAILSRERRITANSQQVLDQITSEIRKNVPGTFASEYVVYVNGNRDMKLLPHLLKAYELAPDRTETYPEFIAHYELTAEPLKKQEFCKKLYNAKYYHKTVMDFNYNLLMSLELNAVLITNAEYDTYPAWLLQSEEGVRKDVRIINASLLENPAYRLKVLSEAGLTAPAGASYESDKGAYFSLLAGNNGGKPLYFSLTLPVSYTRLFSNRLFVTGLASRYSPASFENLPLIKENLERRFRKLPARSELTGNDHNDIASVGLESNYLIPMLLLYDYYIENREKQKAEKLKTGLLEIARACGQETTATAYLDRRK